MVLVRLLEADNKKLVITSKQMLQHLTELFLMTSYRKGICRQWGYFGQKFYNKSKKLT